MYFEEQIQNGKLCWRSQPKGEWTEYSKEELTQKLLELKNKKN